MASMSDSGTVRSPDFRYESTYFAAQYEQAGSCTEATEKKERQENGGQEKKGDATKISVLENLYRKHKSAQARGGPWRP